MLSKQEVSHQQVMSYLVGGGDKYTSETYRILHFGSFERYIIRHWKKEDESSAIDSYQQRAASHNQIGRAHV